MDFVRKITKLKVEIVIIEISSQIVERKFDRFSE